MQLAGTGMERDIIAVGKTLAIEAARAPNFPIGYAKALEYIRGMPHQFVNMAVHLFDTESGSPENGLLHFIEYLDAAVQMWLTVF